jgi:hypothetical protein
MRGRTGLRLPIRQRPCGAEGTPDKSLIGSRIEKSSEDRHAKNLAAFENQTIFSDSVAAFGRINGLGENTEVLRDG